MEYRTKQQAKIITKDGLKISKLPHIWSKVAGLLVAKKRLHPLQYQKAIRREWANRIRKVSK